MRTARISVEAAKKSPVEATIALELLDEASGKFVPKVRAALPVGLSVRPSIDDPRHAGVALSAQRVSELCATSPVPVEVGLFLHRLMFGGKLAADWSTVRRGPVRLLLRLGANPALQSLPWERTHDDQGDYLALTVGSPLARWVEPSASLRDLRVDDWPIRMLIVNGAAPGVGAGAGLRVAADDEMIALERILSSTALRHDVEYDVLEHPTRQQIVDACRMIRPHVLHVIAHAQDTGAGGELLLWQPPAGGQPAFDDPWRAADLRLHLQTLAPRLVFINACRSSAGAPSAGPVALASLTQAFLQAGSAATIGMQGEVAGDLAQAFAEAFYTSLFTTPGDIDTAVLEARVSMAGKRPGASVADDADWAFPVLTRCVPHDQVVPRTPQRLAAPLADRFVSRLQERREAHEAIRCAASTTPGISQNLAVIVGRRGSGKSYLGEWTAQACRRAGMGVADVTFNRQDKVDWLDALRWMRDGQRRTPGVTPMPLAPTPGHPLGPVPFRHFNWALNRWLEGLPTLDPPPADDAPIPDRGQERREKPSPPETFVEDTFAAFQDALAAAAPQGGLLFKLDQLDGIEDKISLPLLAKNLVQPVAAGQLKNVRLLLVVEQETWAAIEPHLFVRPRVVTVPYFKRGDFDRVARQYCHQWPGELYAMQRVRNSLVLAFQGEEEPVEWGSDILQWLSALLQVFSTRKGAVT